MSSEYRNNVCCIVLHKQQALVVKRPQDEKHMYKCVQGGIEEGETIAQAAQRELREETHITNAQIIFESSITRLITWSEQDIQEHYEKTKEHWIGQKQHYVVFEAPNKECHITEEVDWYDWIPLEELLRKNDEREDNFKRYDGALREALTEMKQSQ